MSVHEETEMDRVRRAFSEPCPFVFRPSEVEFVVCRRVQYVSAEGTTGAPIVSIARPWVLHSPTGYEWGYMGSGPADLALNVLGLFVPPYWAHRYHQRFKADVIARIPVEGGVLGAEDVRHWLRWVHEGRAPAGYAEFVFPIGTVV